MSISWTGSKALLVTALIWVFRRLRQIAGLCAVEKLRASRGIDLCRYCMQSLVADSLAVELAWWDWLYIDCAFAFVLCRCGLSPQVICLWPRLSFRSLISEMAPDPGIDTNQIKEKARKQLLDLLEGVCKAYLTNAVQLNFC